MSEINDLAAERVERALQKASQTLLDSRNSAGHWTGELSSSALSTATAITALGTIRRSTGSTSFDQAIARGSRWLGSHPNADGGWGDTIKSISNISTTTLCWAALKFAETESPAAAAAEGWLVQAAGGVTPDRLVPAVLKRYGRDRTFSVPILTMCALTGRLGDRPWRHVIQLPFELAAFPRSWFAALRLPVVSYALPALIAMGYARHYHAPSRNPVARAVRARVLGRVLRVLETIQPPNGGFLEATPLTSFVAMSLAGAGHADHIVTRRATDFLCQAQRPDGSWPIDTNLATWVTTLSANGLSGTHPASPFCGGDLVRSWLLGQQYRTPHAYTGAPPGGWAWTDLPGGVPDADDTAGATLALRTLGWNDEASIESAQNGIEWLLHLQNRDGGIPTFCRGWGNLPFDRSAPDLTAHALRAWAAWEEELPARLRTALRKAVPRALRFLKQSQRADGAWVPLWFGNQFEPNDENPIYGTSRVLLALADMRTLAWIPEHERKNAQTMVQRGTEFLLRHQNADGGWGKKHSSNEETAWALEGLAAAACTFPEERAVLKNAITRGGEKLIAAVESGSWTQPAPVGFYFARLWYFEELYPKIFAVAALNQIKRLLNLLASPGVASPS